MGIQIKGEFYSDNGGNWEVYIYNSGYASTVTNVIVHDLNITWESQGDDILEPLKASRAAFSLINDSSAVDSLISAIKNGDEDQFHMVIEKESNKYNPNRIRHILKNELKKHNINIIWKPKGYEFKLSDGFVFEDIKKEETPKVKVQNPDVIRQSVPGADRHSTAPPGPCGSRAPGTLRQGSRASTAFALSKTALILMGKFAQRVVRQIGLAVRMGAGAIKQTIRADFVIRQRTGAQGVIRAAVDLPVGAQLIIRLFRPPPGVRGGGEEFPLKEKIVRLCRYTQMMGWGPEQFVHRWPSFLG